MANEVTRKTEVATLTPKITIQSLEEREIMGCARCDNVPEIPELTDPEQSKKIATFGVTIEGQRGEALCDEHTIWAFRNFMDRNSMHLKLREALIRAQR